MRSTPLALRIGALVAATGLLLTGCSNKTPDALPRREVPAAVKADTAKPCTREAPEGGAAADPAPRGVTASFDAAGDKIVLSAGQNVTLPALSAELGNPALLKETAPGEWLLAKTIEIGQGASLKVAAPTVRWLKLRSDGTGSAS
jgi:hypothetical protein